MQHPDLDIDAPIRPGNMVRVQTPGRRNTRARIVSAALELMRVHHGPPLSLADVAIAAGLSRRAVYNHFESADALREAAWDMLIGTMAVELPRSIPKDVQPGHALPCFAESVMPALASHHHIELVRAIAIGPSRRARLRASYITHVRQPLARAIETYVLHRKQHGEFALCDAQTVALQLVETLEAVTIINGLFAPSRQGAQNPKSELDFAITSFLRAHVSPASTDINHREFS